MKVYISPEIKIEGFQTSDVITVSLIFRVTYPEQATEEMNVDYDETFWS